MSFQSLEIMPPFFVLNSKSPYNDDKKYYSFYLKLNIAPLWMHFEFVREIYYLNMKKL